MIHAPLVAGLKRKYLENECNMGHLQLEQMRSSVFDRQPGLDKSL